MRMRMTISQSDAVYQTMSSAITGALAAPPIWNTILDTITSVKKIKMKKKRLVFYVLSILLSINKDLRIVTTIKIEKSA